MRQRNILFLLIGLLFFISSNVLSYPILAQDDSGPVLMFSIFSRFCDPGNCRDDTLELLNAETGGREFIPLEAPFRSHYDAGWSPDGRYIWTVNEVEGKQWRLRLIDVETLEERIVSEELPVDGCAPSSLSWSPDGEHLIYYTGERGNAQFNLLNMVDKTIYTDDGLKPRVYIEPVWSPDGRFVAISSGEQDRLIDVSDGTEQFSFAGIDYETSFSPDGRYLLYQVESPDDTVLRLYDTVTGELGRFPGWGKRHSWSPDSRYLVVMKYDKQGEVYALFDTQTTAFTPIDIGEPIRVGPWIDNGTALFLYANQDGLYYRSVLRYEIDSVDLEILFETTGWIGLAMQHEQWTIILYSPSIEEEYYEPTRRVHITDGETVIDEEIVVDFYNPFTNARAVAVSPDGRWVTIAPRDGIYRFNTQTGVLDHLPVEARAIDLPFWSPDGKFLAFETFDPDALSVWNTATSEIDIMPQSIGTVIGWQNGDVQNSLLYCGPG